MAAQAGGPASVAWDSATAGIWAARNSISGLSRMTRCQTSASAIAPPTERVRRWRERSTRKSEVMACMGRPAVQHANYCPSGGAASRKSAARRHTMRGSGDGETLAVRQPDGEQVALALPCHLAGAALVGGRWNAGLENVVESHRHRAGLQPARLRPRRVDGVEATRC